MSTDQSKGSAVSEDQTDNRSAETQEQDQFVKREAYEQVSKDMHKFKSKAREAEAAKAEYEAKLKALEEEKLVEQKRFQELYEKEKQERESIARRAQEEREAWLASVKKSALKSELGKIKDAYLVHADISMIQFTEDGQLDMNTVHAAANKFRQEYPELVPTTVKADAAAKASPTNQTVSTGGKSLDELSGKEAYEMLKRMGEVRRGQF